MTDKFIEMRDKVHDFIENLMQDNKRLFLVNLDRDDLYAEYLKSIPVEMNPIYRVRQYHDCSCCRGFIKNMGAVIAIKNGKVTSIWDCDVTGTGYESTFQALSEYVKSRVNDIGGIFLSAYSKQGCHHNFEEMEEVGAHRWDHFYVELKSNCYSANELSRNRVIGEISTSYQVFKRGLETITLSAIDSILDLISTNTLYKGAESKRQIEEFRKHKVKFEALTSDIQKKLYVWENVVSLDGAVTRIKNTAIGTLLVDVSEGRPLDEAVTAYEKITAPENYKRPKPVDERELTMFGLFNDGGNCYSSRSDENWYWSTSEGETEKEFRARLRRQGERKAQQNYREYVKCSYGVKVFKDIEKFKKACEKVGLKPNLSGYEESEVA